MKTVLSLFFISLVSFISEINSAAQTPLKKDYKLPSFKTDTLSESLSKKYFKEANRTEILTDLLIAKKKEVDKENLYLRAEVKRLKKVNEFLKSNSDTIVVHDTVFKRRKFYQIFKN